MKTWQIVRVFAGLVVVLSLALGVDSSPLFIDRAWLGVTVFMGLNLMQSGFTNWCLLERILRRMGVPTER